MSTHKIYFPREIRKISELFGRKKKKENLIWSYKSGSLLWAYKQGRFSNEHASYYLLSLAVRKLGPDVQNVTKLLANVTLKFLS